MPSSYFEYAVPLNRATMQDIIDFGARYGWDLDDELRSVYHLDEIELTRTYVSLVWDVTTGCPDNFQTFPAHIFEACWRYVDGQRGPFSRMVKIHR